MNLFKAIPIFKNHIIVFHMCYKIPLLLCNVLFSKTVFKGSTDLS